MAVDAERSQQEVAAAIKRTTRQVHNLTKSGVFVRIASADDSNALVYPWPETLERWIAYQDAQRASDATASKAKAAALKSATLDLEMKAFRFAQMKGEWVRREEYATELRRILTAINGVLDLAPGTYGPQLPGDSPIAEKVEALRAVVRDIRAAMRKAGAPADALPAAPESAA